MMAAIILPARLGQQLRAEAVAALPRECCGLVEGILDGSAACVTALHPMPNLAEETDRFEIDPAAHIALLRRLRAEGRRIIGCYHSHPDGRSEPSERDREGADEEGFLWLIAGVCEGGSGQPRLAGFVSTGGGFSPVRLDARSLDRPAAPPV